MDTESKLLLSIFINHEFYQIAKISTSSKIKIKDLKNSDKISAFKFSE